MKLVSILPYTTDTKHLATYAALYYGFKKGVEMLQPNRGRVDPMNPADGPT